jgi:hypothetical protein
MNYLIFWKLYAYTTIDGYHGMHTALHGAYGPSQHCAVFTYFLCGSNHCVYVNLAQKIYSIG